MSAGFIGAARVRSVMRVECGGGMECVCKLYIFWMQSGWFCLPHGWWGYWGEELRTKELMRAGPAGNRSRLWLGGNRS
jgi:hypothetical protein